MRLPFVVVATILASLLSGWASAQTGDNIVPGGRIGSPSSPLTWEYKELSRLAVEDLAAEGEKDRFAIGLNKLGSDGWELVAVDPAGKNPTSRYLFKRPKTQHKDNKKTTATEPVSFQIIRMKNAKAAQTAKMLLSLFRNEAGLQVVADDRTNSLLVGGTLDQKFAVQKIVSELDSIESEDGAPKK